MTPLPNRSVDRRPVSRPALLSVNRVAARPDGRRAAVRLVMPPAPPPPTPSVRWNLVAGAAVLCLAVVGGGTQSEAMRKSMQTSLQQAMAQAKKGRVEANLVTALRGDLDKLTDTLKDNVGAMDPSDYMAAKHYLGEVGDAVKGLQRADASRFLDDKLAVNVAKTRSVADLVKFMADHSLKFGPAQSGDEWAYVSLHRALAAYDRDCTAPMVAGRF